MGQNKVITYYDFHEFLSFPLINCITQFFIFSQFPTVGFVVERYKAIENFIPEPFWKLKVIHQANPQCKVEFSWKRSRLFDHAATQLYKDICDENPKAKVEEVKSKPKSKWRPLPMDTVELEKLSSKKLRISAKETMKIAEKVYAYAIQYLFTKKLPPIHISLVQTTEF